MAASVSRVKIMDARSKGWVNTWVERTHNCRGMTDTTQHSPNLNWHTLVVEFRSLSDWFHCHRQGAWSKIRNGKIRFNLYALLFKIFTIFLMHSVSCFGIKSWKNAPTWTHRGEKLGSVFQFLNISTLFWRVSFLSPLHPFKFHNNQGIDDALKNIFVIMTSISFPDQHQIQFTQK